MTSPGALASIGAARRVLVAVLAAALGLASLAAIDLGNPAPGLAIGPLPACRYDDILTQPADYADWQTTLVDTILSVPATYVPPDLTPVSKAGIQGSGQVRALVIDDLAAMTAAAKAAGTPIAVQSAYRSYLTQVTTFNYWVKTSGHKAALLYSARPGHSEHQLGLAIDFKSAVGGPPWSGGDWGNSPAGTWMRLHAWQYGFVLSYPKGKTSKTCYDYESWHYRYLGRTEAAAVHASGLTIREYLWIHDTTAVVPPAGSSTPSPDASAAATLGPSPSVDAPASEAPSDGSGSASASPAASTELASAPASGAPTGPPAQPAGVVGGSDPTPLVAGFVLVALVVALVVALAAPPWLASRRAGPSDPPGTGSTT